MMICWKTVLATLAFLGLVILQVHSNQTSQSKTTQVASPIDGTFQSPTEKMAGK